METVTQPVGSPDRLTNFKKGPDFFRILCWVASACAVATLAWIVAEITWQAWPSIREYGFRFLTDSRWVPSQEKFGVLPFLLGTMASSLFALVLALPLGLAIAIFLSEDFLPLPVRQVVRFTVEMLAAIPSVVYGLWGIFVIAPLVMQAFGPTSARSMLTASLVLALMILPTITAVSRTALVAVPGALREGAYALGATRWEAIFGVILPTAAPGIVAATILALGRAMGETMAVAMLIGNSPRFTWSLLSPAGTLAGLLANEFGEAEGLQVSSLMYAALLLVVLTLFVNMAGEFVLRYTQRRTAGIR